MSSYLCVALGGALGAVARYAAGNIPVLMATPHFKTMFINITGCLVIGMIWTGFEQWHVSRAWYNMLIAGFLGGFTTYSSFSLEAVRMAGEGRLYESLLYALVTVTGCIAACATGIYTTKLIIKLI